MVERLKLFTIVKLTHCLDKIIWIKEKTVDWKMFNPAFAVDCCSRFWVKHEKTRLLYRVFRGR